MSEPTPAVEMIDILTFDSIAVGDVVEFYPKYVEADLTERPFRVVAKLRKNVRLLAVDGSTVRTDPFLLMRSTRPFEVDA